MLQEQNKGLSLQYLFYSSVATMQYTYRIVRLYLEEYVNFSAAIQDRPL